MPSAYVMINSEFGAIGKVVTDLKKIRGVEEVVLVNGIYDIVAKVTGTTDEKLERTNMEMRGLDGVLSTMTLIVSRNY
jgi:DNA-binding Lrp family transcriptional regulator